MRNLLLLSPFYPRGNWILERKKVCQRSHNWVVRVWSLYPNMLNFRVKLGTHTALPIHSLIPIFTTYCKYSVPDTRLKQKDKRKDPLSVLLAWTYNLVMDGTYIHDIITQIYNCELWQVIGRKGDRAKEGLGTRVSIDLLVKDNELPRGRYTCILIRRIKCW